MRIYRRFRLAPHTVVTGAFNAEYRYADLAEREAEAEQERELQARYASLPESVRSQLGMTSGGGMGSSAAPPAN